MYECANITCTYTFSISKFQSLKSEFLTLKLGVILTWWTKLVALVDAFGSFNLFESFGLTNKLLLPFWTSSRFTSWCSIYIYSLNFKFQWNNQNFATQTSLWEETLELFSFYCWKFIKYNISYLYLLVTKSLWISY